MSSLTLQYGRNGRQAAGDPQVAELLARTVAGQHQAVISIESFADHVVHVGATLWTVSVPSMAIAHSRWLTAVMWQMATSYLDGNVVEYEQSGALPQSVYGECDALCDLADAMTLKSIQLKSGLDQGVRPTNAQLVEFPTLDVGGPGYIGVWYALHAVFLQVRRDLVYVEAASKLKQMQKVHKEFMGKFQPLVDQYAYLVSSWGAASSEQNRRELVRTALPLAEQLFVLGQQVWAPYLLGKVYTEALRYKPTLEDLEISDPWMLTDPLQKKSRLGKADNDAQLTEFWTKLADPAGVIQLQQQLQIELQARRIRLRFGRGYNTVPWPGQYLVRYPVTFGARTFNSGDLIAMFVDQSAEKWKVEVRKTGHLTSVLDRLGQAG